MAIQYIFNSEGAPTNVVLTMEEWQGILSSNANIMENIKSDIIEVPQEVQDEMMKRLEKVTPDSGITRKELRSKLGL